MYFSDPATYNLTDIARVYSGTHAGETNAYVIHIKEFNGRQHCISDGNDDNGHSRLHKGEVKNPRLNCR